MKEEKELKIFNITSPFAIEFLMRLDMLCMLYHDLGISLMKLERAINNDKS